MMEIVITVYKPTGKWYASKTVLGEDIPLYDPRFKQWVRENAPALCNNGFVTVADSEGCTESSFHCRLYRTEDLI